MNLKYKIEEIESCEQIGEFEDEYVYDIEVDDDTHTFIGNDILVHNSLYVSYMPIMKSCGYDDENGLEFIHSMDRLYVKKRFESWLDDYATKFKRKNIHDFELETVNRSSMHIQKKHYINNVVWEDGIFFNDMEHFIPKGVEIVKSSTPGFVRGKKQKGGIWYFIDYLFRNPDSINSKNVLKIMKDLKSQFKLAPIEDISFTTSLSNYSDKVIDDQNSVECVTGAHFSVKAAAMHNYLLNKNSEFKTKYDLLKGGRVKWYFIKNNEYNDRIAYLRSFHPYEVLEKEKIEIDWDKQFEKSMLDIVNRFLLPIGLPEINKRLGVLNELFGGENVGDMIEKKKKENGNDYFDDEFDDLTSLDEWEDEFDF
jgi:hypothetical protein